MTNKQVKEGLRLYAAKRRTDLKPLLEEAEKASRKYSAISAEANIAIKKFMQSSDIYEDVAHYANNTLPLGCPGFHDEITKVDNSYHFIDWDTMNTRYHLNSHGDCDSNLSLSITLTPDEIRSIIRKKKNKNRYEKLLSDSVTADVSAREHNARLRKYELEKDILRQSRIPVSLEDEAVILASEMDKDTTVADFAEALNIRINGA